MLYRIVHSDLTINSTIHAEGSFIELDDTLGLADFLVRSPDAGITAFFPEVMPGTPPVNGRILKIKQNKKIKNIKCRE